MRNRCLIIVLLAGSIVLSGCSLVKDVEDSAKIRDDAATNKAKELIENTNAGQYVNTFNNAVNQVQGVTDDGSSLLPEVNVNATLKKTVPPRPQY